MGGRESDPAGAVAPPVLGAVPPGPLVVPLPRRLPAHGLPLWPQGPRQGHGPHAQSARGTRLLVKTSLRISSWTDFFLFFAYRCCGVLLQLSFTPLSQELYVEPYSQINWNSCRNNVCPLDRYIPQSTFLWTMFGTTESSHSLITILSRDRLHMVP